MSDPQHVVYEVSLNALLEAKKVAVRDFLARNDCYDSNDLDDVDVAIRCVEQAFDLCEQAEKIAKQMMTSHDPTKGIEELERRRPGYLKQTYTDAINEAMFRLSR